MQKQTMEVLFREGGTQVNVGTRQRELDRMTKDWRNQGGKTSRIRKSGQAAYRSSTQIGFLKQIVESEKWASLEVTTNVLSTNWQRVAGETNLIHCQVEMIAASALRVWRTTNNSPIGPENTQNRRERFAWQQDPNTIVFFSLRTINKLVYKLHLTPTITQTQLPHVLHKL